MIKGVKKIGHYLVGMFKGLKYTALNGSMPKEFLHEHVPYFSQWESRELNKQIIKKEIQASDDPKWKKSGAATKEEYTIWSWSVCGMACTKMLLAYRTGDIIPLVTLGKKCLEYGGYTAPIETSTGLQYKAYLTFVQKEFGWKAKIISGTVQEEIMYELGKGNYVIASVSPLIRELTTTPRVMGGHLVLLLGYNMDKAEFYLHNSSGTSMATQEYAVVPFADFKRFFSGRGIVIQGDLDAN